MTCNSRSNPVRSAEALRTADRRSYSLPSAKVSSVLIWVRMPWSIAVTLLADDNETNAELLPLPTDVLVHLPDDVTDADRYVFHEKSRLVAATVYTPEA